MHFNAIISLIKSNSFDEAKDMLDKTMNQPEFLHEKDQSTFRTLQIYFLLKDKKYGEALEFVPKSAYAQSAFMRAHLFLQLKKHKECILELINIGQSAFIPLILRLAHNYKLLDTKEVK